MTKTESDLIDALLANIRATGSVGKALTYSMLGDRDETFKHLNEGADQLQKALQDIRNASGIEEQP